MEETGKEEGKSMSTIGTSLGEMMLKDTWEQLRHLGDHFSRIGRGTEKTSSSRRPQSIVGLLSCFFFEQAHSQGDRLLNILASDPHTLEERISTKRSILIGSS